jgi:hypothetical protein
MVIPLEQDAIWPRAILKSRSGATKTLVCCVETRCVDDIERPGMLHGAFLRSPLCSRAYRQNRRLARAAKEVARHVGAPIVLVIADSRYVAEDAVSAITVEYEALAAVTDLEGALRQDGPHSRGLFRLLAGILSPAVFRLLQQSAPYSISLTGSHEHIGSTMRPSVLAVLRLITNSNFLA